MSRFSQFPASFTKSGPTVVSFQQLASSQLQLNQSQSDLIPGGAVDVSISGLSSADPQLAMSTKDLLTFFTHCSPSGILPFTSGVVRNQKRDEAGTFLTGTDHELYNIAKGVLCPKTLSASQQDVQGAMLDFAAIILYDGTNIPVTRSTAQSLAAAPVPAYVSRYYMSDVFVGGTQINNLESTTIDFGVNYVAKGFNGSTYPTEGAIITRTPKLSFTGTDLAVDAAVNVFLRSLGAEVRFFYQAGVDGSDRVAKGTASHLKISASGGSWSTDNVSTQGNEDGLVTCSITPNAALAVNVGSAIS